MGPVFIATLLVCIVLVGTLNLSVGLISGHGRPKYIRRLAKNQYWWIITEPVLLGTGAGKYAMFYFMVATKRGYRQDSSPLLVMAENKPVGNQFIICPDGSVTWYDMPEPIVKGCSTV